MSVCYGLPKSVLLNKLSGKLFQHTSPTVTHVCEYSKVVDSQITILLNFVNVSCNESCIPARNKSNITENVSQQTNVVVQLKQKDI